MTSRDKRVLAPQSEAHVYRHKISSVNCTGHPTENRGCVLVPQTQLVLDHGRALPITSFDVKCVTTSTQIKWKAIFEKIDDKNARDFITS